MITVEIYIGLSDNTWYLEAVEIPIYMSEARAGSRALDIVMTRLEDKRMDIVFSGVYSIYNDNDFGNRSVA